jgi:enoyl-CoA hydratase/carnithine racemase
VSVRYESLGPQARLTIDREDRRNALSPEVIGGLIEALERAAEDADARAVVLTGAGEKAFCAGGDLGGFSGDVGSEEAERQRGELGRLFRMMHEHPKPIIARTNGQALGGGFGLMLACDLVVAAEEVEVGTPEINLGLWPYIITAVIQRNVPRKVALELMLLGKRIPADEAARWGLINRVVPRADLDQAVDELVKQLAAKSPLILAMGKASFYRAQDMAFEDSVEYLNTMLTKNLQTEDVVEGVSAFLQKREPDWKGR